MLVIQTPQQAYVESVTPLGPVQYNFVYRFNTTDNLFRLDIQDFLGNPIVNGLTLKENYMGLLLPYYTPEFDHGDLLVIKSNQSAGPLNLLNLGIERDYNLVYITNQERQDLIDEGVLIDL